MGQSQGASKGAVKAIDADGSGCVEPYRDILSAYGLYGWHLGAWCRGVAYGRNVCRKVVRYVAEACPEARRSIEVFCS